MKVRKAIIPAAGLGTRFLPATKAMPKEMLPIVDRPTIEFIVDEAIQSGIKDILIVTGKGKRAIEDHFDINLELEQNLVKKEKHEQLNKIKYSSEVEIHYIRQKEPKGLGHAIWCARNFIGNEPFAVLLGDDIVESSKPCLAQLIDQFDKTQSSIVGVQKVLDKDTERYGIIDPLSMDGRLYEVQNFVEKPKRNTVPSNLAIVGRYILTPEIFPILSCVEMDINGEIQLTDAIEKLNKIQRVFAYEFEGKRYDVGEKIGFIQATMEFAINNNEIGHKVEEMLKELLLKRLSKDEVNL